MLATNVHTKLKGPFVTYTESPSKPPIRNSLRFLRLVSLNKLCKFQFPCGIWIVVSITLHQNSVMGLL